MNCGLVTLATNKQVWGYPMQNLLSILCLNAAFLLPLGKYFSSFHVFLWLSPTAHHDFSSPKGEYKWDLASHGAPSPYSQWLAGYMSGPSRTKRALMQFNMGIGSKTIFSVGSYPHSVRTWAQQLFLPHDKNLINQHLKKKHSCRSEM